ncbi:MAG: YbaK/EbsC family protein [Spirochaetales bacterium]|nr:YbaK/EbsC family protein [Spirochaetales bacterium]
MIPKNVAAVLQQYNLSVLQFEEGSTPTAETAAEKIGVAVGQIAKSMLFRTKDGYRCLVVCAGDLKVNSSKLKQLTGRKMSMASAEETEEATGYKPGGVCPFGLPEDMPVFIDISLKSYDTVYPAAGTDSTGVPTTFAQLLKIAEGRVCDVMRKE